MKLKLFIAFLSLAILASPVLAQQKYGRGYLPPSKEESARRHVSSNKEHGPRLVLLRSVKTIPASYDAMQDGRDDGIVGDQGGCGNCYWWSAGKTVLCAQYTAGLAKPGAVDVSIQWGLDCHPEQGGCNGGDEYQVAQLLLTTGIPSLAQYPGLGQNPGNCGTFTGKPFTIASVGYCDPNAGPNSVASTASIQVAILQYGPVSTAGAAGSWGNPGATVMVGQDSNVDHAFMICGWKTGANGKVVWKCKNQWSDQWGDKGYMWIEEGSYSVGTEAFFVTVGALPPPPPPPPGGGTTATIIFQVQGQPDQSMTVTLPTPAGPSLPATIILNADGTYTIQSKPAPTKKEPPQIVPPKKSGLTPADAKAIFAALPKLGSAVADIGGSVKEVGLTVKELRQSIATLERRVDKVGEPLGLPVVSKPVADKKLMATITTNGVRVVWKDAPPNAHLLLDEFPIRHEWQACKTSSGELTFIGAKSGRVLMYERKSNAGDSLAAEYASR